MRVRPDQIVDGFDSSYYLLTEPDVAAAGVDPLAHFNASGWQEGRFPNGLFDPAYYLAQNPDVAAAGVNPLQHYLTIGYTEGRNPSALFDQDAYLAANPDVAAAGVNPLLHYLQSGAFEGRTTSVDLTVGTSGNDFLVGTAGADTLNGGAGNDFFTPAGGNDTVNGGAGIDTARFSSDFSAYSFTFVGNQVIVDGPEGHDTFTNIERFAFRDGTIERNDDNPMVDDLYYYANNPDVWAAGADANAHYMETGWHEGRNPNQYFDTNYYLEHNPDVAAAGVNPLQHYLESGAFEGRNPSALFDSAAYLAAYPDVAAAHVNPLLHFLESGQFEGRSPLGIAHTTIVTPEDTDHVFTAADFTFFSLASVESVNVDASGLAHGTLFLDTNDDAVVDPGEAISGTVSISLADIDAGRLHFRPDANASGNDYGSFDYTGSNGAASSAPGVMTINVTPVNDAPDMVTLTQPNAVQEGSLGGTLVGTAHATDPDAGTSITFSLRDADGSAYTGPFAIDPASGTITVAAGADGSTIDFEKTEGGAINLIVRATDETGLFRDQPVNVQVANVAESNLQAIEGYIANATVFVDANDNGQFDSGEYSVKTDAVGGFHIVGDHGNHAIILLGGNGAVDTATGLPFDGALSAPAGSTVLTPITTLIAALVAGGATVADASQSVATALNLPNADYTTFDPIAASVNGDTTGDAVFAAGVQVYNTIVQATSLLTGAGANAGAASTAVLGALVDQIQTAAGANSTISLADTTVLTNVISAAGTTTSTDVSATAAGAANVISGSNTLIQQAVDDPNTTGTDLLKAVTGTATVAQGDAAAALQQAGQSGDTSGAESNFTGSNLDSAVATATANVDVNTVAGPNGDNTLVGTADADILDGQGGSDTIYAGGGKDLLIGGAGDDMLDGDTVDGNQANRVYAFDRADYSGATEAISVDLGAGTVHGGPSTGDDNLRGIEAIIGTNFNDSFNASTFSAVSTNNGGIGYQFTTGLSPAGNVNQFEGMGGDDTITGNGITRISYQSATAGVNVNLQTGVASGDISVGTDHITGGVSQVRGSSHDDMLIGSHNGPSITEQFQGLAGDDFIDGNGGFDRVRYDFESTGALGITVNLGAGTVTGRDAAATAVIGTDTLRSIESIRGTQSADIYDATTFTASSTNGGGVGDQGNFNEFEGLGGNDTITGNGNTRIAYYSATSGVTVTETSFGSGTVTGDGSVGTDTFTGVANIRGSNFGDTFTGFNNGLNTENFEGWAGNDFIDGGLGFDRARYDGNNGDSEGVPLILGMSFDLAAGIATGRDANALFNYGTDTLRNVEAIRGTNADDIYTAVGFSPTSTNHGNSGNGGAIEGSYHEFNEFEGGLGNDDITGNGGTRVSYANAGGAVNVNLGSGATGAAGTDTFHGGINAARGSNFNDTLTGTNNASDTVEVFEGMAGNDTIDGGGGFDLASYQFHQTNGFGVLVTRGAGSSTVTGINGAATAGVGTDTLINIEMVRGTNFADTYNATGFVGFNDFQGMGGNDDITGNGNTRISYHYAPGSVTIDLGAGTVTGADGSDTLHGGINAARGSQFNDFIRGSSGNDTFTGYGGVDTFAFGGDFGNDTVRDFVAGQGLGVDDVLQLDHTQFADFNAVLANSQQNGADTVISLDPTHSITLLNVSLAALQAHDFVFV